MKIKYDLNLMNYRTIFENITHAQVKDCFLKDDLFLVVVKENEIGKAIGKGGMNIRALENKFNKKIKIVEFSDDLIKFTKNWVNPVKIKDIKLEDDVMTLFVSGIKEKGQIIGRDSKNLHELKDILGLYFHVKNVRVQ